MEQEIREVATIPEVLAVQVVLAVRLEGTVVVLVLLEVLLVLAVLEVAFRQVERYTCLALMAEEPQLAMALEI